MNKLIIIITVATMFTACKATQKHATDMGTKTTDAAGKEAVNDTTPRVTGVGGIFFFCDNPEETRAWYANNLGLDVNEWGSTFATRNVDKPEEVNYLQWSPFKKGSKYFAPSAKEFMINYRVQHIEGLVSKLRENGVTILDDIETFPYGKFVHIMDAEGNKIELWEPVDSGFTETEETEAK